MPSPRITRLRSLLEKATKGPWKIRLDHVLTKQGGGEGEPMQDVVGGGQNLARLTIYSKMADGDLIVAMHGALPSLLDVVEAAIEVKAASARMAGTVSKGDAAKMQAFLAMDSAVKKQDAALARLEEAEG